MIQTKPYEFMTKYTPQREWIEGGGIFICLAFFTIELGGGTFVFSSIFDSLVGMVIGFLLTGLGTIFFLVHTGRPIVFYRACLRPQASWISRGVIFISLFLILAFLHICSYLWLSPYTALMIITNIIAFMMMIYAGFAMNSVNSIPLWNTTLLPLLLVVSGFWGGAAITLATSMATGSFTAIAPHIEEYIRILLIIFMFILVVYLLSIRYGLPAGQVSVKEIIWGRGKALFWTFVVVLGVAFPLGVVAYSTTSGIEAISRILLAVAVLCELAGDFTLRYLIMRNAFYGPLTPV